MQHHVCTISGKAWFELSNKHALQMDFTKLGRLAQAGYNKVSSLDCVWHHDVFEQRINICSARRK